MGGLVRAARQLSRRTPALSSLRGGFTPTQPGDPDFSRAATPGTQLQFPAAAAESRVHDVRTRAVNQLNAASAAGLDVTSPEFNELNQAARQGYVNRKPTLGESLLGWVGAPFETVNLFIQDFIDTDKTASLRDYGNALWGGIEDNEQFFEDTGFRPESFSNTLTMFGWEPNDEPGFQPERILRGIADFGSSVLIDPLTYVTGGLAGLGRKTAVAAGRVGASRVSGNVMRATRSVRGANPSKSLDDLGDALRRSVDASDLTDYEKHLVRTHKQTMDEFDGVMADHIDDIAQGNFDNPVVAQLNRYLGGEGIGSNGKNAFNNWEDLALGNRISRELLQPLNRRDFAAINALALKELPVWARGGLRLGLPSFSTKFANVAVEIPHTRGLGRKLVGDPLRDISAAMKNYSKKYTKVADAMSSGRLAFDAERPLLNGLRDGTLAPWQYHISATAMDNVRNQFARQEVSATLRHHGRVLLEQGELAGEEPSAVWRTVLDRLEQVSDEESLMKEASEAFSKDIVTETATVGSKDLDRAVDEVVDYMRTQLDDLHANMSLLDPKFKEKYIDGYITHSLSDDGRSILGQFIHKGANVPRQEWASAAERGEPGKGLLARLMNTAGGGGVAETNLGSNRFVDRMLGRLQAQSLVDDGPIMLEESYLSDIWLRNASTPVVGPNGQVATDVLQTRYAGVSDLNEWLESAVRANADEYGIVVPKHWDGKIFKDNPLEIVDDYYGAMDDTIKQWTMIDSMKMAGLVTRHSVAVDTQDVLQSLMANMYRVSEKIDGPDVVKVLDDAVGTPKAASILPGRRDLVDGIPKQAIKPLRRAGLDPTDIGGTKQLYQTVQTLSPEDFRGMRNVADDMLPGIVDAGERGLAIEGGDSPAIRFVMEPGMTEVQREALFERSLHSIDDAFMSGDLKGKLNHTTLVALAKNAPNDETSDLLRTYFKNKMASLGDAAREYLGADPGEFVEITVLADDFYQGVNDFVSQYSAKLTRQGELVQGGRQAQQLADETSQFTKDLKALRTAARDLSDRGYDEAVDVMRKVDDVTGVVDLPGYIQPHRLGLAGPAVEGMQIQRDIGLWLKNVSRNTASVYTPEGVAAAKLATGQLLRTWRALATVARPAFHIRNAQGAAFMNMAVGVRGATYKKMSVNTLKWRKALRDGLADPYTVIDDDVRAAWKAMVEEDVLSGFVASEATGRMTIADKTSRVDWLKVNDPEKFVATRVGSRAMESIEDVARASLFLEYFQEGVEGSAKAARDMVHAIHFDYSNLTPLETKFKSIIPFFVWTRRNLPRQLEMMVEKPALVQRYKHLMQAMNDNLGGTDDDGLPTGDMFGAYAAGTNMYVNPNTPFWARVMIDPDLPTSDLLTIPNLSGPEVADFVNNLLGPHIGTLFDINSQREWGDVNSSATMGVILKGLAQLGMFDETLDGDVRYPYWIRTLQETGLPFEREIVDPFLGGPADTNRQQRYGIAEDDNPVEAGLKALIASLARGVGVKFNTPVDVRGTAFRSQEELDKIIEDLRQRGELPPSA